MFTTTYSTTYRTTDPTTHTHCNPARVLSVLIFITGSLLSSSCATMIYAGNPNFNKSVLLTGAVPPEGVVLKSTMDLFLHSSKRTTHTKGFGVEYTQDGSMSKMEKITDVQASRYSYVTSGNTRVELQPSPGGASQSIAVYCNCSLQESKKRGGAGQAILEPACSGPPRPAKVSLQTKPGALWVVLGIVPGLGLGYLIDRMSGYLYDYEAINIARTCKRKR